VLALLSVENGDRWTSTDLLAEIARAEPDVVRERALRLLAYRERTRHELTERLTGEGLSADAVSQTLDRLETIGALSDERFAEWHARSKVASGWGRPRIERSLEEKGVDRDMAAAVLDEFAPSEAEVDRALALIATRHITGPKDRDRALARLARRGYSPSDALAALRAAGDLER
jgi:regulatory protein